MPIRFHKPSSTLYKITWADGRSGLSKRVGVLLCIPKSDSLSYPVPFPIKCLYIYIF